jgi:hypothetical protein
MRTSDLHVVLQSEYKRHTSRLSGCHTVPKGITAFLSVFRNFKVGKIISVRYDNNSKHLSLPKP